MNIINEEWVGLNFLPTTASSIGNSYLRIKIISSKKKLFKEC